MIRKWLVVGIILLFVGVTIAPAMNANDIVITDKIERTSGIALMKYPKLLYFNVNCNISGSASSFFLIPFGTTSFQIFKYILAYRDEKPLSINCIDLDDTIIGPYSIETTGGLFPDEHGAIFGILKLVGFVGTMSFEWGGPEPYYHFDVNFKGHVAYVRSLSLMY